jgi:hypothetical protein
MDRPEKFGKFIYAILEEARRDSLVDVCDYYGIDEAEMYDCLDYLNDELKISTY